MTVGRRMRTVVDQLRADFSGTPRRPSAASTIHSSTTDGLVPHDDQGAATGVGGRRPDAGVATTGYEAVSALCDLVEPLDGDPRALAEQHVGRVAPLATRVERDTLVDAAVARLVGFGPLHRLLDDDTIDEILVNGPGDVWIERRGQLQCVATIHPDELAVIIERILAPLGRRLDRTSPIVDARLPDGSRVCAAVAPVAVDGTVLAIRRFRVATLPLAEFGTPNVARAVEQVLHARCNVIVSGQTSSGKTTLLNSALELVEPTERLVVVEDNAELSPTGDNIVRLESRRATPDQPEIIGLDALVKTALRLRPDRLVVGEVRGDEVLALVQALNTGHDGSWSTVHANSAHDALIRLETLVLQAAPGWPLQAIRQHLYRSIDVIIQTARTSGGARRIVEISEVVAGSDAPHVRSVVVGDEIVGEVTRTRA